MTDEIINKIPENQFKRFTRIKTNLPRIHKRENISFEMTLSDWSREGGQLIYVDGEQALPENTEENIQKLFANLPVCPQLRDYLKQAANQGGGEHGGFLNHSLAVTKEYFALQQLNLLTDQDRFDFDILDNNTIVFTERFNINGYFSSDLMQSDTPLAIGVTVSTIRFDEINGIQHELAYDKIVLLDTQNNLAETEIFNRDLQLHAKKYQAYKQNNQLKKPIFFEDETLLHKAYGMNIDEVRAGLNKYSEVIREKGLDALASYFTGENILWPNYKCRPQEELLIHAPANEIIWREEEKPANKKIGWPEKIMNGFRTVFRAIGHLISHLFSDKKMELAIPLQQVQLGTVQQIKMNAENNPAKKIILPAANHGSRLFQPVNIDGIVSFLMNHQSKLQEEMQGNNQNGLYAALCRVLPNQNDKTELDDFIQNAMFSFAGNFRVKLTNEQTDLFRNNAAELQGVIGKFEPKYVAGMKP